MGTPFKMKGYSYPGQSPGAPKKTDPPVLRSELDDKGKEHAEEIVKSLENLQIAGSKPYFYEEVDKENKHNLNYKIGVLRLDS